MLDPASGNRQDCAYVWPRRVSPAALDVLALVLTVGVAAATRFSWLDLMEFKGDEAEACRLALHALGFSEPGVGRFFPTRGLVSSVGVPNPPLFVYLVAIPLAIVRSPLAAVVLVAAANVAAVAFCYVVGRRCYSRFVGFAAAALWALAPWAIVFSRKIWAQDLLPICTTLFVLALDAFLVRKRASAAFWLCVLLGVTTQLHFSAWVLAPVLVGALILGRDRVERRWLALGIAFIALVYAPFLIDHAGEIASAAHHHVNTHVPALVSRFTSALRFTFAIVGGDRMSALLGSQSRLAHPLSIVLGATALLGTALAWRSAPTEPIRRLRLLLLVWYVLPLAVLSILPTHDYIHYFIVITPLPFLGLAYMIERLATRQAVLGGVALAACLVAFLVLDIRFFRTVIHDGGAPGDYGIAYRDKANAVRDILRANPDREVAVGLDRRFRPSRKLRDIHLLLWNGRLGSGSHTPLLPPTHGYVFVDRFTTRLSDAAGSRSYGPLEVVPIKLAGG